jgi:hypothetical protein
VSFSVFARKVRDPTLPYRRRESALHSCVQLYRPIGFHATLSFLEQLAGPFQRDEAALLRALDAIVASRDASLAEIERYAAARSEAKRRGQRSPRPRDPNPHRTDGYWYGAARQAALHTLRYWQRDRLPALLTPADPLAQRMGSSVEASVAAGGELPPEQRQLLTTTTEALRERLERPGLWSDDKLVYFRTLKLLALARLVEVAADAS